MTNQGKTDIIKTTASFLFKKKAENKKTNFQKRVSFKNGCFTEKQFKHHRKKICFRAQFGGLKTGKKRGGDNAQLSSHYSEVKGRPTWSREGVPRQPGLLRETVSKNKTKD